MVSLKNTYVVCSLRPWPVLNMHYIPQSSNPKLRVSTLKCGDWTNCLSEWLMKGKGMTTSIKNSIEKLFHSWKIYTRYSQWFLLQFLC